MYRTFREVNKRYLLLMRYASFRLQKKKKGRSSFSRLFLECLIEIIGIVSISVELCLSAANVINHNQLTDKKNSIHRSLFPQRQPIKKPQLIASILLHCVSFSHFLMLGYIINLYAIPNILFVIIDYGLFLSIESEKRKHTHTS